ncbi:peptidoglycan DD-metalloendopeptidase family protein [Aestuariibacter halophilus]|uniref:Peptidoglycan DD-metalloendopeptidase family protein n=1 Tax=Fluctibacter halophilus TaxID=226011 RepID=A0ABS8GDK6_9ALTE|nr:peptidoglycan DD-metalloendopeptidase family protein [Aestuariibacter halophilus]MCC2617985.1 peptidoglycan DD-metalloendopeptidase family protein [Aestuariibacter halophilus]
MSRIAHWTIATTTALSIIVIGGCAQRTTPAPVIELYQGKDYRDFEADSWTQKTYQVKKGDTLFAIAWQTGNDYRDLARWNNIPKPYHIYPGQQLTVRKNANAAPSATAKNTGQTSKINANQAVDRPQKQAYGDEKSSTKTTADSNAASDFPSRVSRWQWPANGALLNRFSLQEQGNKGIDISGKSGDPIVAAADGKVVYTGNALRGYGNLVIIKHSETFLSAYAHNKDIKVSEQQWVKAGQVIASMGRSGTESVKLHFEVRYKGKSVDPLRYLPRQ